MGDKYHRAVASEYYGGVKCVISTMGPKQIVVVVVEVCDKYH